MIKQIVVITLILSLYVHSAQTMDNLKDEIKKDTPSFHLIQNHLEKISGNEELTQDEVKNFINAFDKNRNANNYTALELVVRKCNLNIMKFFIKYFKNLIYSQDWPDTFARATPLHYAMEYNPNSDVIDYLTDEFKQEFSSLKKTWYGYTLLGHAARSVHNETVAIIVDKFEESLKNPDLKDFSGQSTLSTFFEKKRDPKTVTLILEKFKDELKSEFYADKYIPTLPLHYAVRSLENIESFKILYETYKNEFTKPLNKVGSLLKESLSNPSKEVVEFLLQEFEQAFKTSKSSEGEHFLHEILARNKNQKIIDMVIKKFPTEIQTLKKTVKDYKGETEYTPLEYAALHQTEANKTYLKNKFPELAAKIDTMVNNIVTQLTKGNLNENDLLKLFKEIPSDTELTLQQKTKLKNLDQNKSKKAFHLLAKTGTLDNINFLIKNYKNDFVSNTFLDKKTGNVLFQSAALNKNKSVTELLLEEFNPNYFISLKNNNNNTPLHAAAYVAELEPTMLLAKKYPNEFVSIKNKYGNTPLHLAAQTGNAELVELLTDQFGEKFISLKNNNDDTPLHLAAKKNTPEAIKYLAEKSQIKDEFFNSENKNKQGQIPFELAKLNTNELVKKYVKKFELLTSTSPAQKKTLEALKAELQKVKPDFDTIFKLLAKLETLDDATKKVIEAKLLRQLAQKANLGQFKILEKFFGKALIDESNKDIKGRTVLHGVLRYTEDKKVVKHIIEQYEAAVTTSKDNDGKTPLNLAKLNKNSAIKKIIEQFEDTGDIGALPRSLKSLKTKLNQLQGELKELD